MDIKFNSIYIFDVKKEEAYTINFEEGIIRFVKWYEEKKESGSV